MAVTRWQPLPARESPDAVTDLSMRELRRAVEELRRYAEALEKRVKDLEP